MVTVLIMFGVLVAVLVVARMAQSASGGQTRRRWTGDGSAGWGGFDGGGHHHDGGHHHSWGGHDGGGGHGGFDGGGGGHSG